MIDEILIKNFQSHEDSHLSFSPGVNVIIGSSDSGKSAIKRALCAVTDNNFSTSFIRTDESKAEVSLFIEGFEIKRTRSNTENSYFFHKSLYEGFGTNIPEIISNFINFNELNVQHQADTPFLIAETSGEVSRFLNKKVNLEIMDTTLKNLNSKRKKVLSELEFTESEKSKLEVQIQEYDFIKNIEKLVLQGEKLEAYVIKISQNINLLSKTCEKIQKIQHDLSDMANINSELSLIEQAETLIKSESSLNITLLKLKSLISSIQLREKNIKEKTISDEENESVEQCLILYKEIEKSISHKETLNKLLKRIDQIGSVLKQHENKISRLEKEWHEKMPEICPLCGK